VGDFSGGQEVRVGEVEEVYTVSGDVDGEVSE
jgi:hypothetical protein